MKMYKLNIPYGTPKDMVVKAYEKDRDFLRKIADARIPLDELTQSTRDRVTTGGLVRLDPYDTRVTDKAREAYVAQIRQGTMMDNLYCCTGPIWYPLGVTSIFAKQPAPDEALYYWRSVADTSDARYAEIAHNIFTLVHKPLLEPGYLGDTFIPIIRAKLLFLMAQEANDVGNRRLTLDQKLVVIPDALRHALDDLEVAEIANHDDVTIQPDPDPVNAGDYVLVLSKYLLDRAV